MKSTARVKLDLTQLVIEHHEMVWRYLRLIGCQSALAEDLTQETFLSVLQKPPEIISHRATAAFLRLVARNLFIDEMRRQKRVVQANLDQAEAVWIEFAGEDDGAGFRAALKQCLQNLGNRPRQVIDLRYRDKLPLGEVARQMIMRESGVKTLLGRVKRRLRECIERKVAVQ